MKRVGNLYEQIYSIENLMLAHKNARKGKGWYAEVQMIDANPYEYLTDLQNMLIDHTYHTSEYEQFTKHEKGKTRVIYKLPYFPDRICQWAILQVIEPYLMKHMTKYTYSALPNRGIHKAMKDVKAVMQNDVNECLYCLKFDINHYYPSIDHQIMKDQFRRMFKDPELLWLLDEIIDSIATGDSPGTGVPIGNYLSQWCGNLYLSWFDHWLKEKKHIKHVFRYMDDIVIFGSDKAELHALRDEIESYLYDNLKLTMKSNWQVFPTYIRGVDFVGYRIFKGYVLLRKSTCKTFKAKTTAIDRKTKDGKSMNYSEWCSANSYKGWLKYCDGFRLSQKYLSPIRVRMRKYYLKNVKSERKVA